MQECEVLCLKYGWELQIQIRTPQGAFGLLLCHQLIVRLIIWLHILARHTCWLVCLAD